MADYGLILLCGAIALALRHAAAAHPSIRSKRLVGTALIASVAVPWPVAATVLQVGTCVYVLWHKTITDELSKPDGPPD